MIVLIQKIKPFLIVQFIFILSISIILLNYNRIDAHLWVNQYHHTFFDYFFYLLTKSVEFWSCLIIYLLIATLKNYKYALIGLISYATSGLITQILKRNVFDDDRPTYLIEHLRLIPKHFNFEQHHHFSFPSGHTTAAFALFLFLALISKKKWGWLFGLLACITAFSRVYLSQHFFIDILFGSLIGTTTTIIIFYLLNKKSFGEWGDKSLLSSFT